MENLLVVIRQVTNTMKARTIVFLASAKGVKYNWVMP